MNQAATRFLSTFSTLLAIINRMIDIDLYQCSAKQRL
jgi:hypothetical protein